MEAKFTPGPWGVRTLPNGGVFVVGNEVAGSAMGREYKREILSDEDYPRKKADAYLIAAAPELLEALEQVRDDFATFGNGGVSRDTIEAVLSVIAKAKGEGK